VQPLKLHSIDKNENDITKGRIINKKMNTVCNDEKACVGMDSNDYTFGKPTVKSIKNNCAMLYKLPTEPTSFSHRGRTLKNEESEQSLGRACRVLMS
jgi:hypothetical protein